MSLISWNCRGVRGPWTVCSICDMTRSYHSFILGLIETKKANGDMDMSRTRLGFKGRGRSGGLALFWSGEVEVNLLSQSHSHIDVLVKGDMEFELTLFYGSPRV
ncbi:unnamed protein product [Rhodiola kirilowii]